jgi:acetoacetyl-CoA synthetase
MNEARPVDIAQPPPPEGGRTALVQNSGYPALNDHVAVEPIWRPDSEAAENSSIVGFARAVEGWYQVSCPTYEELWAWSTENIEDFWSAVVRFFQIPVTGDASNVLTSHAMPGASWFPDASVNYVSQVFRDRPGDATALVETNESGAERTLTWAELEAEVASVARTLLDLGVSPGDRVVGYLANGSAAVVSFLATASVGAVWACCAQDYAAPAALERLQQLGPVVLIAADGYTFNGKQYDRRDQVVKLAASLDTLRAVITVDRLGLPPAAFGDTAAITWSAATAHDADLEVAQVPFGHPLWVLFTSGTTGRPKGIVHSHGGVTVELVKFLSLHSDIKPGERVFWYTSTNWMVWNVLASCLLVGASIVTYDGSATYPSQNRLWELIAHHDVAVFGTSPSYLQASERAGLKPGVDLGLSSLRLIVATGSVVPVATSVWVNDAFDSRVPLVSTSGGTDVAGAFVGSAPTLPLYAGECTVPALGVALDVFGPDGESCRGEVGELVVTEPMPSMPIYLWDDPGDQRYRATYFSTYPKVWRHGDWVTMTERGSVIIHGRSDATLNRQGVRLGSGDIYEIVEKVPGIREALVVGVEQEDGRYWMPLFVVLESGRELDEALRSEIVQALKVNASPRHVPDEIIAVPSIPHTMTGKKLEVPVKRILRGEDPATVIGTGGVDDPAGLQRFSELAKVHVPRPA